MLCIICQILFYVFSRRKITKLCEGRAKTYGLTQVCIGGSMSDTPTPVAPSITVRDATRNDMAAIADIYSHEVATGVATFEEEPPTADELNARREGVVALGLPYLVAVIAGQVAGYSYASTYRPRPAYKHTIENTVYVARDRRGIGVAATLLTELIKRCEQAGRRQMIAVIAVTDDHANNTASVALHQTLNFRMIGTVEASGFKLGRWVDTVLMQRTLGDGSNTLPASDEA